VILPPCGFAPHNRRLLFQRRTGLPVCAAFFFFHPRVSGAGRPRQPACGIPFFHPAKLLFVRLDTSRKNVRKYKKFVVFAVFFVHFT